MIREIQAKTVLRKHKKIDSWFLSRYGMNIYRGCLHNCSYCDGRAEGYYVEGDFAEDVSVKINAADVLRRELDPDRKRKSFKKGFIIVGGGVSDSYHPVEKEYELTRKALELMDEYRYPVHMLTKSTLIKRDIDILKSINLKSRAIVSFSFSSVDDQLSRIFEPGVPSPTERLEAIRYFKAQGISCGMFLLPVIPYVTDSPVRLEETVRKASEVGVDFIIFGGMTLKTGRQKDHFMNILTKYDPQLSAKYSLIYQENKWGSASEKYDGSIHSIIGPLLKKYGIPPRVSLGLFTDILDQNDRVIVLLEHIDYLLRMKGTSSSFGYAAYSISQLKESLSDLHVDIEKIKGVGKTIGSIIREILDNGTCKLYQQLFSSFSSEIKGRTQLEAPPTRPFDPVAF